MYNPKNGTKYRYQQIKFKWRWFNEWVEAIKNHEIEEDANHREEEQAIHTRDENHGIAIIDGKAPPKVDLKIRS